MEKITKEISLYRLRDLIPIASGLNNASEDEIKSSLRLLWRTYKETVPEDCWPHDMRQWIQVRDEKPKAACGYFSVSIPVKGWNSYEEVEESTVDITKAICKLTGDTYRKDMTIKVGSRNAAGWSFRTHLEDRIMRRI